MWLIRLIRPIGLIGLMTLVGCEQSDEANYTSQLVIESYIYANEPIDSVIVRRTAVITSDTKETIEPSADVLIEVDGVKHSFHTRQEEWAKGHYYPDDTLVVVPGKTYRIEVRSRGQIATSQTTVPLAISLDSAKVGD